MEKTMEFNFAVLKERIKDTLEVTDLEYINKVLSEIKDHTIVSGVGGSSVVSEYMAKVLNAKNNIITKNAEPRDFKYENLSGFKNVIVCSYGGRNYGVEVALDNNLKKYLLSVNKLERTDVIPLQYTTTMPYEKALFL